MEVKNKKPPGKKMLKRMSLYTKWLLSAIGSLLLVGFGLSIFSEAVNLKHTNAPFLRWFLIGAYSLIIINGGLCIFGQAIIFKVRIENKKLIKKALKQKEKRLKHKLSITKIDNSKSQSD
jgi:ABC-type siderophore export system fused ATPase/permease subunit